MGSGEVAIVALSTMISLKVTFSDGLGGLSFLLRWIIVSALLDNRFSLSWIIVSSPNPHRPACRYSS